MCPNVMESSARDRKRDSARKKSEFSVYSQKAVRAKERLQRAKPVVVHDNGPYGPIGQNLCAARLKQVGDKKEQLKK
jgi:hypothetical protein